MSNLDAYVSLREVSSFVRFSCTAYFYIFIAYSLILQSRTLRVPVLSFLQSKHKVDVEAEQEFIANDTVQKEVKLMRVRGQRHGASLPRGHEEVKSSMHANIDGFKTEMAKVLARSIQEALKNVK
jgi:hypothetical protein